MTRAAGQSGRGWTVSGLDIEHKTDTYIIDSRFNEQEVLVRGDPDANGCNASGAKPKKCSDHYETKEVEVFFWRLDETETWTERTIIGCFNPGGRNMGQHQHCEI